MDLSTSNINLAVLAGDGDRLAASAAPAAERWDFDRAPTWARSRKS